MRIGELARATGTTTRALRYYEEQGLLRSRRSANGYREYGPEAARVVDNIRLLLASGLTSEDLRAIGACLGDELLGGHVCPESGLKTEVFEQRLALLRQRISELVVVHDRLADRLDDLQHGAPRPGRAVA
ncbi:MerR family transcriptional regulator [Actinomadura harenae]|uniref:MerR family transcriptional regulator n=1 Tax=Actinomadura harenae TaxID=2483351 RepID=A0A3M2L973_9ACTN|nr:MerR family transcriptional regulator [Actinomadura harenae]RMI32465.1 MerR family transcriptional regulator [Actinomadura harenae]